MRAIAKMGAAGVMMLGGLAFGTVPAQAGTGIALEPAPVADAPAVPGGGSSVTDLGSSVVSAGSSVLSCAASSISGGIWCLPG